MNFYFLKHLSLLEVKKKLRLW